MYKLNRLIQFPCLWILWTHLCGCNQENVKFFLELAWRRHMFNGVISCIITYNLAEYCGATIPGAIRNGFIERVCSWKWSKMAWASYRNDFILNGARLTGAHLFPKNLKSTKKSSWSVESSWGRTISYELVWQNYVYGNPIRNPVSLTTGLSHM